MERNEIKEIVKETIKELLRNDLIRDTEYGDASDILETYWATPAEERDRNVTQALDKLKDDKYYKILPLYYGAGLTIEQLAIRLDVEPSTISRNKKRLCISLLRLL